MGPGDGQRSPEVDVDTEQTVECGRCGRQLRPDDSDWDHWHYGRGAAWVEPSCPYAGQAYEPGACDGDDLCVDCDPDCEPDC